MNRWVSTCCVLGIAMVIAIFVTFWKLGGRHVESPASGSEAILPGIPARPNTGPTVTPAPARVDTVQDVLAQNEKFSELFKASRNLAAEMVSKRRILADLPNYCAFEIDPIDGDAAGDLVSAGEALAAEFGDTNGGFGRQEADRLKRRLKELGQFAVVEVSLDKDGFASWAMTRSDRPIDTDFFPDGKLRLKWADEAQKASAVTTSSLYSQYFEERWGSAIPEKLRATLEQQNIRSTESGENR